MAETGSQFEERLKNEEPPRIGAFWAEKARLKRDGLSGSEAYNKAMTTFSPIMAETEVVEEDDYEITVNCPIIDSIIWAIESLPKRKIVIQDAPSNYAWALYRFAKGSAANEADLIKLSIVKLTPTNKQLEDAARMQDDGSTVLELIERTQSKCVVN